MSYVDRKSTRLNSSHTEIYTLSLHDALPILRQLVDEIVVTIRPPSRGGFLDGPRPGFIDALDVLCNMLPLRHFGHSERSRTHRNRIIVAYMSNAGSAASSFPRWPEMLS